MNFLKNNPIIFLARAMWRYAGQGRRSIVLYVVLFVMANSFIVFEPLVIALLLNSAQKQGVTMESLPLLLGYLSLFFLLMVGFWLFHWPARILETKNAFMVRANYKKYLFDGTLSLPAAWHADHQSGDTIDKIEKGSTALYTFTSDGFMIIEAFVQLIGAYIALIYFNVNSLYIVIIVVCAAIMIVVRFDKILITQYQTLYQYENKISAKIYDILSNITTVIILRVEKMVSASLFQRIMRPLPLFLKNNKVNEAKWFLVFIASSSMTFFVIGSYLYGVARTGAVVAVGTIAALYGYVQHINQLFFRFAYMYNDIVRQKTAVMNAEGIVKDFEKIPVKNIETLMLSHWKTLDIQSLNFSYHTEEGKDLHLDNISMAFRHGEKIALIGASGSGKTTLLKIMRGLYEPKQLHLRVDGIEMQNGFQDISAAIALIPQEPEIFATTIKDNITIGVTRSMSEIMRYTKMACFTDVVERLPKKYQSSIVEKGVNLSGGEKQRLALARGLLACEDKDIVLLDEPTSSVDFKNELDIYQHIFRDFSDKTVISSIHRLHLLPMFDTIYFFAQGKIIARGTLKELLQTSKEFGSLWERYNSTLSNTHDKG